jgi:hypothetical protein
MSHPAASGCNRDSAVSHSRLLAAASGAGFFDRFFDRFTGFTRALLNPANYFFLLSNGVLEIVIRELGPFLLQLAFGDVPVALNFECCHRIYWFAIFRFDLPPNVTAKVNSRPALLALASSSTTSLV